MWWYMRIISTLRLRQENSEFGATVGYTVRPGLKKTNNNNKYKNLNMQLPNNPAIIFLGINPREMYSYPDITYIQLL
jgi:hypothetical protein